MQKRARAERLRKTIVLTPSEKKAIIFILIAFVLGFVAKEYRAVHPHPLPQQFGVAAKHNHSPARRPSAAPTSPPEHADAEAD